jgi:hypothetical protein
MRGPARRRLPGAAEELAGYENKFTGIDVKLERVDGRISAVQSMRPTVLVGVVATVLKLFVH